jgi:hypothetical protein
MIANSVYSRLSKLSSSLIIFGKTKRKKRGRRKEKERRKM